MKFTRKRFLPLFLVMLAVLGLLTAVPVAASGSEAVSYADEAFISNYAKDAVALCRRYNVMHGANTEGCFVFRPLDAITRQEIFRVVYALNNAGKTEKSLLLEMVAKTSAFEDKGDIAAWAMDSAGYCISTGLFIGDHQNRLNPKANITYFECAIVFLRLIGYTQETLAVQAGETVEQWRLRVTKLADSRGLFNGVLFYANDRYDQKICRQDVAVMCANALNGHTVTFYPVQDEAVYVENQKTLAEQSFGELQDQTAIIVGLSQSGYRLSDGNSLPTPDYGKPETDSLGRRITYAAADNNPALSWDGAFAEGESTVMAMASDVVVELRTGGVMIRIGGRALIYSVTAADVVYLCHAETGAAEAVSYEYFRTAVAKYQQGSDPVLFRAVINENGMLQSVLVTRIPAA